MRFVFLLALCVLFAAPGAAEPPTFAIGDALVCDGNVGDAEREDFDERACEQQRFSEIDPQGRLLWLRKRVTLSGDLERVPLALFSGALASREIWWNGEEIGTVGRPGASRAEEEAGNIDAATYIPPHLLRQGDNLLAIRISSFDGPVRARAPMHFLVVGPLGDLNASIFRAYVPAMLTAGALIAAAIYFGVAFSRDRRDLGALFIALMSTFAVLQLGAETLRGVMDYPYPFQIWRLIAISIFAFGFALSMTAYVARRFAPERWPRYVAVAAVPTLLLAPFAPGFDIKTLSAILIPTLVSLAAAARGVRARRSAAAPAAVALLFFAVLIIVLNAPFLDQGFYFAAAGLVLVLLVDQLSTLWRAREAEAAATSRAAMLELELLRRRIAPHFLMNTLNALAEWVESDPRIAVKMIDALAEEFRLLAQMSGRACVPLADEIALCRRHLELMSFRTDRAFSLRLEGVDESLRAPPGIIHTLIENAFTHGRFADGAEFVLRQEEEASAPRLVLMTPRPAKASENPGGGEGISYVRGCLEAACGPGARFEHGPSPDGGWRTVLTLARTP